MVLRLLQNELGIEVRCAYVAQVLWVRLALFAHVQWRRRHACVVGSGANRIHGRRVQVCGRRLGQRDHRLQLVSSNAHLGQEAAMARLSSLPRVN